MPYVLGNNLSELVKTRDSTNKMHLGMLEKFVGGSRSNVNLGFFFAYKCLLESLASDDRDALYEICEGNLYNKLSDSLDLVNEKKLKLKLLNAEKHKSMTTFSGQVKLIDFQNYAGCRIDRKLNKENGLKEANPFFISMPNITVYMPSNPFKMTANFLGSSGYKGKGDGM